MKTMRSPNVFALAFLATVAFAASIGLFESFIALGRLLVRGSKLLLSGQ